MEVIKKRKDMEIQLKGSSKRCVNLQNVKQRKEKMPAKIRDSKTDTTTAKEIEIPESKRRKEKLQLAKKRKQKQILNKVFFVRTLYKASRAHHVS